MLIHCAKRGEGCHNDIEKFVLDLVSFANTFSCIPLITWPLHSETYTQVFCFKLSKKESLLHTMNQNAKVLITVRKISIMEEFIKSMDFPPCHNFDQDHNPTKIFKTKISSRLKLSIRPTTIRGCSSIVYPDPPLVIMSDHLPKQLCRFWGQYHNLSIWNFDISSKLPPFLWSIHKFYPTPLSWSDHVIIWCTPPPPLVIEHDHFEDRPLPPRPITQYLNSP